MNYTMGFIGTGNMGGALARAAAKAVAGDKIYLSNRTMEKAERLAAELGCKAVTVEEAAKCDYVFLGVKPQMMGDLLAQIAPILESRQDDFVLVSMAAGITMADIQKMAGGNYPVIRIMPNTPVAVGSGVILYDVTENVSAGVLAQFCKNMQFAGLLDLLPEALMDAGTAVAGCGPAFAALFMEALEEGGVHCGLPREKAGIYARQMVLGAAQLALQSEKPLAQLRQEVCSPGGSTIEGVRSLEKDDLRTAVIRAVQASFHRNQELGKTT